MGKIAVIIPTYKAHDTIGKTVASVINQIQVDHTIYLSVDGEPEGTYDYLKKVFPEIEILYSPKNQGPGGARQYGIDNTTEPFLTFMDSDDLLSSLSALYTIMNHFDDTTVAVYTTFLSQQEDGSFEVKEDPITWMHGKVYRRDFIDKYNIHFGSEYQMSNEDAGFNTIVLGVSNNDTERIKIIPNPVYLWMYNPNSIVRKDNAKFNYTKSIEGYVGNKIFAVKHIMDELNFEIDEDFKGFLSKMLVGLYVNYYDLYQEHPDHYDIFMEHSKKFYNELYKPYIIDKGYLKKDIEIRLAKDYDYKSFKKWKKEISKE